MNIDNTLITAFISLVVTSCATTFIGIMLKRIFQKQFDKRDELYKLREEKEEAHRRKMFQEYVAPINKKLDAIGDGTLSALRNDILTCYYKCLEKGYRNDYDYENIHHMYEAYSELNGNSYVRDIIQRFDALPTKEAYRENGGQPRSELDNDI